GFRKGGRFGLELGLVRRRELLGRIRRLGRFDGEVGGGGGEVTARIIDGKAIALAVRAEVAAAAAALRARAIAPALAVVLVGDDPASAVYVRNKTKAARDAGVDVR